MKDSVHKSIKMIQITRQAELENLLNVMNQEIDNK